MSRPTFGKVKPSNEITKVSWWLDPVCFSQMLKLVSFFCFPKMLSNYGFRFVLSSESLCDCWAWVANQCVLHLWCRMLQRLGSVTQTNLNKVVETYFIEEHYVTNTHLHQVTDWVMDKPKPFAWSVSTVAGELRCRANVPATGRSSTVRQCVTPSYIVCEGESQAAGSDECVSQQPFKLSPVKSLLCSLIGHKHLPVPSCCLQGQCVGSRFPKWRNKCSCLKYLH